MALGPNGIAQRCGIRWALSCVNPASWLSLATRRKFAQHRPRLKAQLCTPRGQRRRGEEKRRGRTARVNKFIWARNCRQSTRVCSGRSILISDGNLWGVGESLSSILKHHRPNPTLIKSESLFMGFETTAAGVRSALKPNGQKRECARSRSTSKRKVTAKLGICACRFGDFADSKRSSHYYCTFSRRLAGSLSGYAVFPKFHKALVYFV